MRRRTIRGTEAEEAIAENKLKAEIQLLLENWGHTAKTIDQFIRRVDQLLRRHELNRDQASPPGRARRALISRPTSLRRVAKTIQAGDSSPKIRTTANWFKRIENDATLTMHLHHGFHLLKKDEPSLESLPALLIDIAEGDEGDTSDRTKIAATTLELVACAIERNERELKSEDARKSKPQNWPLEQLASSVADAFEEYLGSRASANRRFYKICRKCLSVAADGKGGARAHYDVIRRALEARPTRKPGRIGIRAIEALTDERFAQLSEAEKKRLRGD